MSRTSTLSPVRTSVSADIVRAWLVAHPVEGETIGSRGRFSAEQIKRYNSANKGSRRYVQGVTPEQGVEVKGRTEAGKIATRKVVVSRARQTLAAQGVEVGKRGRLSESLLLRAAGLLPL